MCAYKGAFGVNYDVNIKGTVEEAQEFESMLKKETDGYFFNHFDDDDENTKQNDDDDEESSGHRSKSKTSRHHHQSSSITENNKDHSLTNGDLTDLSTLETDNFAQRNSKLLQSHPIKVNLMFRYRHYQMVITFTYYSKLGMFARVCVGSMHWSLTNGFPIIPQN